MDEDEGIPISNDLVVSAKSIDFDLRHNPFLLPRGAENCGRIFSERESALDLFSQSYHFMGHDCQCTDAWLQQSVLTITHNELRRWSQHGCMGIGSVEGKD